MKEMLQAETRVFQGRYYEKETSNHIKYRCEKRCAGAPLYPQRCRI